MIGSDFYTAMTTIDSGFSMDPVLFYQFLNAARINREMMRPFMRLRKFDYSQTVTAQTAPVTAPPTTNQLNIPSDFLYLTEDGEIIFYDQNNTYQVYTEVGMQNLIPYLQVNNVFYMDHANGKIHPLGVIDRQYTAFILYQANLGDITANTTWLNIPSQFHMILAFDVAAMYRLGVDYDDIQARNADSNAQQAELLFNSMAKWDDALQRSATTRMQLPRIAEQVGANFNHKINIEG